MSLVKFSALWNLIQYWIYLCNLAIYLIVYLSICLSVYLPICLIYLSIYLSSYLSRYLTYLYLLYIVYLIYLHLSLRIYLSLPIDVYLYLHASYLSYPIYRIHPIYSNLTNRYISLLHHIKPTWNPNDPSFDWKAPSFEGLFHPKTEDKQVLGIYIYTCPI